MILDASSLQIDVPPEAVDRHQKYLQMAALPCHQSANPQWMVILDASRDESGVASKVGLASSEADLVLCCSRGSDDTVVLGFSSSIGVSSGDGSLLVRDVKKTECMRFQIAIIPPKNSRTLDSPNVVLMSTETEKE